MTLSISQSKTPSTNGLHRQNEDAGQEQEAGVEAGVARCPAMRETTSSDLEATAGERSKTLRLPPTTLKAEGRAVSGEAGEAVVRERQRQVVSRTGQGRVGEWLRGANGDVRRDGLILLLTRLGIVMLFSDTDL
jgi:hypothetical protein